MSFKHGKRNVVLFITDSANGLSNAHVATCSSLLENHPEVEVHYSSFPKLIAATSRITAYARAKNPECQMIHFHEITGDDYKTSVSQVLTNATSSKAVSDGPPDVSLAWGPPGHSAIRSLVQDLGLLLVPWDAASHWNMFSQLCTIIEEVDPAVVILDPLFHPALDAARNMNRRRIVLNPNALHGVLSDVQPRGAALWKYPAFASGSPFPLPWKLIPSNVYSQLRLLFDLVTSPSLRAKRAYLSTKGIKSPLHPLRSGDTSIPILSMAIPESGFPLDVIPPHVVCCGPMVIDVAPASSQDAELATWVSKGRTMLINLGSVTKYNRQRAHIMLQAIVTVLQKTDIQVLWKLVKLDEFSIISKVATQYIEQDRLRIVDWLKTDPASLLLTGDICVSVHHGGANSYLEAILAGLPQVILPLWADTYDCAQMAEHLGIGIWPGQNIAPLWDAETLSQGFMEILTGTKSLLIQKKAAALGEVARRYGGSKTAATMIAKVASEDRDASNKFK
ncbi:hypothetical protein QQS21_005398 [Conoideocrella luteorostrata]|uniref:Erythromycin biosynthesis protein CIII-like C-terminal domain-containing protein n=1 Tax=Conoideocrella luteorostrata TaxID=1105319 RepID=A0AAJ0G0Y7_9HYPO|nr:hypothetical protein QQS21_005398 [Conoideocrella luteorostrata]